MIEDVEEQASRAPDTATGTDVIALAVGAVLAVAIVAGVAVISIPDPGAVPAARRDDVSGPVAAGPPPGASTRSPMETVYRMFDLTTAGLSVLSSCWTPGRAPGPSEIATYIDAGRPRSLTVASVIQRYEAGQLVAELNMRATWTLVPPAGWASDESRLVTLRHHASGAWTIDSVRAP